jgi:ribosomal protein L11 methyltransferase
VVNDFVAIRANFHQPIPAVKHQVIITPKMSFGTGHHATTCLVIEEMEKLDLAGKTVLDFGTGTGILAILAEKMGAAFIKAIDNDDWSIDNAIENIAANHCERIVIEKAETIPGDNVFDIILANINLNVIMANLTTISHVCKKDSTIILSGFLHTDETELLSELSKQGFAHLSTSQKGEWIALVVKWEGR